MAKKKQGGGLSERAIRALPYESRILYYNREKDELLRNHAGLPARELAERHEALIKKWGV